MAKKRKGSNKHSYNLPAPTPGPVIDGAQLIEDFITYKRATKNISKSTVRAYETYLTSYVVDAGGENLIASNDIAGLEKLALSWLNLPLGEKEEITSGTWNRKLAYLKAFFQHLKDEGVIKTDALPLTRIKKRHEDLRILSFGSPEVDRARQLLLDTYLEGGRTASALDLRNYLLFGLLSTCGLRAGEAGSFARQQIDITQGRITIFGKITKTKSSRLVPIPHFNPALWGKRNKAKSDYQEYFEIYYNYHVQNYPPEAPFICTGAGGPMTATNIWHTLKPVFATVGMTKARVHDLRHYALTRIALNGGHAVVQQIAGHASPSTTARYITPPAHVICQIASQAIDKATASGKYL